MKKEWYVVNTVSGYEYKVKEKLEMMINSMELHNNIYRVVVPEQKVVEMVMSDEAWYIVRNTQGVTGFIGSSGKGAKPIPLLPQEVDKILGSMGLSRIDATKELEPGKKVKILDGPFKDMEGTIVSADMKTQKVNVSVDLFGQVTSIEVDLSEIGSLE